MLQSLQSTVADITAPKLRVHLTIQSINRTAGPPAQSTSLCGGSFQPAVQAYVHTEKRYHI